MARAENQTGPDPISIVGPTAVGKSDVAGRVAQRIKGEIISVDSMQVYRGLDIGTAKPSIEERQRVPHHLIDIRNVTEPFDAAQFVAQARMAQEQIQARRHVPIFCGGTGLYFRAYFEGLGKAPASDPGLRAKLERIPLPDLLEELERRDPLTYRLIDRRNPRRVIRAVEVIRLTGKPFSGQRAQWSHPASPSVALRPPCFGLKREPSDLRFRIEARVDAMFARGWVAETRRLLELGLADNRTAMQAIGYREIVEHLCGRRSLEEAIALTKTRTHQFAKRQMTWFRRQLPVVWIEVQRDDSDEAIAEGILGQIGWFPD